MIEQTPPAGPRAKRPARTRRIPASVGLDPADLAALDALAARLGRTRSALIREAVQHTWLIPGPTESPAPGRPEPPPSGLSLMSPEERASWRSEFGAILNSLHEGAVSDMTEEELATLADEEIAAHRAERRAARAGRP